MSIVSAIVVYLLAWWISLFAVLPWGLSYDASQKDDGHMPGAPQIPNLKKKFMITTVIAFVVLGIVYALIEANVIDFYGEAARMMEEDSHR